MSLLNTLLQCCVRTNAGSASQETRFGWCGLPVPLLAEHQHLRASALDGAAVNRRWIASWCSACQTNNQRQSMESRSAGRSKHSSAQEEEQPLQENSAVIACVAAENLNLPVKSQ